MSPSTFHGTFAFCPKIKAKTLPALSHLPSHHVSWIIHPIVNLLVAVSKTSQKQTTEQTRDLLNHVVRFRSRKTGSKLNQTFSPGHSLSTLKILSVAKSRLFYLVCLKQWLRLRSREEDTLCLLHNNINIWSSRWAGTRRSYFLATWVTYLRLS